MDSLIILENISAGYNGNTVLENINLNIYEQDFLGVIGPNGGGKTTLLKVLLGLLKPSKGKVVTKKKLNIGYLPQYSNIDRKFPICVDDVILSGLAGNGKVDSETKNKLLDETLVKFGISEFRKRQIGELSGGQTQRVFLARALISRPDVLLLDEPNTFMDNDFSSDMYRILTEINDSVAIVLVSHDTGVISSYIKNIACINRTLHYHPSGKISNEILKNYNCPVEFISHGDVPHRVLLKHGDEK